MAQFNRREALRWSAAGAAALALRPAQGAAANGRIRLGFIGTGGRGNELIDAFLKEPRAEIRWLCDADEERLATTGKKAPAAHRAQDLQRVIESDEVDAVVIATCNHWHCLAAVRAMAAGKHVYVEKPLGHNVWEGRQAVAAARKYKRVVQLGTQQRSDPVQAEIKKFLHDEQALGKIQGVAALRFGVRQSIGKLAEPLKPAASVDFDKWLGPAAVQPIYRPQLHYDWHWDWNTGCGEMGNWGVHILDDVVNVVFRDRAAHPDFVQAAGGRIVWDDAGQTPNVHIARMQAGDVPVVVGLSNLPQSPSENRALRHDGVESGYVVYCEGGQYRGWRAGGVALDPDGREIRKFRGTSGMAEHVRNFLDAVEANDSSGLNAEVAVGDASTNWCHLANLAVRAGTAGRPELIDAADPAWHGLIDAMRPQLQAFGVDTHDAALLASERMTVVGAGSEFQLAGPGADVANKLLTREFRKGYEFAEITA